MVIPVAPGVGAAWVHLGVGGGAAVPPQAPPAAQLLLKLIALLGVALLLASQLVVLAVEQQGLVGERLLEGQHATLIEPACTATCVCVISFTTIRPWALISL